MSLKPNEVKTPNIASYAVTESKLAPNSVGTDKLKDNAVKTVKIGAKSVTGEKIADRSISTAKIIDGAITGIKIADGAITRDKISNGVLGRPLTPPVATVEIADNAVSGTKLQNNSVTKDKIKDGEITNAKIAANTITAAKIAANAVGSSEIAANAVGYAKIASQSLEPKGIKTISGLPATEGQIPVADLSQGNQWWFRWADAATRPLTPPITEAEIGQYAVTYMKIAPNSVNDEKISNSAITTDKIQDGAVTAEKLAPGAGGDRFVFLPMSVEGFYLAGQSDSIDWTVADLSPWIPAGAKAAIVQLGMFTESTTTGARADMRLRANEEQRESLGITNKGPGQVDFNFGIVPITPVRTVDYRMDVNGVLSVTFWITVVGYII
jgi:hypothetical protein